ncbi:hypothetical protein [Lentzea californiensis]|uniref:hypothetical protein n=1 Tax=Lentzea californiensis TaxID=438851 RepID=UPI0021666B81|nr:hypothetical protein [Lentzea californiensis]
MGPSSSSGPFDGHQAAPRHEFVRRERRLPEEVARQRRSIESAQRGRPVVAATADQEVPQPEPVLRLTVHAVAAFAAPRPAEHDVISLDHR